MHLLLTFSLLVLFSIAFLIMGLIIAFRPDLYCQWVRWSRTPSYFPWLTRGWAEDEHYGWRVKFVGVVLALGGVILIVLTIWVCWFQK
jgi:hypothetical protein